jgi:hypothetical protein
MRRLKELRESKHLTQADLGKLLKIAPSTIGMYEQGRREPDSAILKKISKLFNVSTDYLLYNDEGMSVHESFAPYGKSKKLPKPETDLDILLDYGGYLTYSDKPLTEQQKQILREFVKVLVKEESSDAEAPANRN